MTNPAVLTRCPKCNSILFTEHVVKGSVSWLVKGYCEVCKNEETRNFTPREREAWNGSP